MHLLDVRNFKFIKKNESFLTKGTFIIRISETDHLIELGKFCGYKNENAIILKNIIDLKNNEYFAESGILKITSKDEIFIIENRKYTHEQLKRFIRIIKNWALFPKLLKNREKYINFILSTFPYEFIFWCEENLLLNHIFIPVQQKFKIGKYSNFSKWEDYNHSNFKWRLDKLYNDDYITYMGRIPVCAGDRMFFYSKGKFSHIETEHKLKCEPVIYDTNCGGSIKCVKNINNVKFFVVDAGSTYKGKGALATFGEADIVADYLNKMYPEFVFMPARGRKAKD